MYKRFRKIAAAAMAASLLLSGSGSVIAQEVQTVSGQETASEPKAKTKDEKKKQEEKTDKTKKQDGGEAGEEQTPKEKESEASKQTETLVQGESQEPQSGESQTEPQTKSDESQTQAPTESQTQGQTQADTQPQSSEPQTEPQTKSDESQTQAPTESQTQGQTQADTQPQSGEPQTQGQTQSGEPQTPTEKQTESQTQTPSEKQTETDDTDKKDSKEKEADDSGKKDSKEKETERSERKNDGAKLSASDITAGLGGALSYLFAAQSIEGQGAALADQSIAQGEEGKAIVSALDGFSEKLADAKSSSSVGVINIYADKSGKLDEAQLKKKFKNLAINVEKKYYVVNIIADSPQQDLTFAGYQLVSGGVPVVYEEESEPGDVLYNFAALDGDEFTGYEGTITLANGGGLQGTYLAPEAEVHVQSDLSGAVYADTIKVTDSADELLHIAFATLRNPEPTETETEDSTEALSEPETEPSTEALSESETEPSTEALSEPETEPSTEALSELETEDGTESLSELETELGTEVLSESETELGTEALSESESETEIRIETEQKAPSRAPMQPVPEAEQVEEEADDDELLLEPFAFFGDEIVYSAESTELALKLADAEGTALTSGKITIRAAKDILNEDGTVRVPKDGEIVAATDAFTNAADVGKSLQRNGSYYLEISELPAQAGYLATPRIYIVVDENGRASFSPDSLVEMSGNTGTIKLYKADNAAKGTAVLNVWKADAAGKPTADAVKDAVFVVKKDGAVVYDATGNPYYVRFAGSPVVLGGLAAGAYTLSQLRTEAGYVIAADIPFEIKAEETTQIEAVNVPNTAAGAKTLEVFAQASYNGVLLTADQGVKDEYHLALFEDAEGTKRVSEVALAHFDPDQQKSTPVVFRDYDKVSGTTPVPEAYYVLAVDEYGEVLLDEQGKPQFDVRLVKAADTQADFCYNYAEEKAQPFPTGSFYYMVEVELTKQVRSADDKERATAETFYAKLYEDEKQTVEAAQFKFEMKDKSTATAKASVKVTAAEEQYYLAETDQSGAVIDASQESYPYAISYEPTDQTVTVVCEQEGTTGLAKTVKGTIVNRIKSSKVVISIVDASGKPIEGVRFIFKNMEGKRLSVNNTSIFASGKEDLEIKGLKAGETYLLSEIEAPEGYASHADVEFTVKEGGTTTVTMKHKKASATEHSIKVQQQVYAGGHHVYAQVKKTYYVALFSDEARTRKVSDVQAVTVSGLSGTTTFKNLKKDTTYYIARTDQYGIPLSKKSFTTSYSDGGKITVSSKTRTVIVKDEYRALPSGYRYTAVLTLAKRVENESGEPVNMTGNFYAGIFRTADFSDTPTIVPLTLKDAASVSAKRRILLAGDKDVTYYIAEVDKNGNILTSSNQSEYEISVDHPQVHLTKSDNKTVTITNQQVSKDASKVTLYLTKRVYEGTEPAKVNETFYAGLFKDASFTQLYTKPIPLQLKDKSEVTLKLSLNLGTAKNATIYVAEVDKDGRVITPPQQEEFGYEVKMINSTAAFTKENREVQTVLLNSVYGTASPNDWDNIFTGNGGFFGGGGVDYGAISGNGEASASTAAKTGDDTPLGFYLALLAASFVLMSIGIWRRKADQ